MVRNEVDPSDLAAANKITLLTINVSGTPATNHAAQFKPTAPSFPPFLADITSAEVKGTKKLLFASGPPGGVPTPAMHTIDGKKFDGEVGEVVLLNTVEEWKVMNATLKISHPFHIHINPFQVVEVFNPNATVTDPQTGTTLPKYVFDSNAVKNKNIQCLLNPLGNPDDWKPCDSPPVNNNVIWWDVFPIPSGTNPTDANGNKILDPATNKPIMVPGFFKMRSRFVDYSGFYVIHCHILAHEDRGMMTIVEVAPRRTPYSHH
jgi:FtsP/CotA-like multicopper oxidase with cupredoxin domain